MENITEMLKGVLEGCILEIISREETYGYEITRKLNTLGFTDVVDGTVYTLNEVGQRVLKNFWEKWKFVAGDGNDMLKRWPHFVMRFYATLKHILQTGGRNSTQTY